MSPEKTKNSSALCGPQLLDQPSDNLDALLKVNRSFLSILQVSKKSTHLKSSTPMLRSAVIQGLLKNGLIFANRPSSLRCGVSISDYQFQSKRRNVILKSFSLERIQAKLPIKFTGHQISCCLQQPHRGLMLKNQKIMIDCSCFLKDDSLRRSINESKAKIRSM